MAAGAAPKHEWGLFIDGMETDALGGEFYRIDEPATGEPLAIASAAGPFDVERAIDVACASFETAWGHTGPTERSRLLHALADVITAREDELAELEARNVGKAISSVRVEVARAIETFRFFATSVASIGGRSGPVGESILGYTLKEPVGVCAQIVPWSSPLLTASWKLAPAFAAGCPVVLKPDPRTPLTALRLAELAGEAGYPPGALSVVPGGPEIGAHLVESLRVARVAFTGSTEVGMEVMRLASASLKRVTLELGRKSPTIVFADADLESAIPSTVWSIFNGAGQGREARSRILVERSLHDEFVSRFIEAAARLRVGDPLDPSTQVGSLISTDHRERAHRFVEHGRIEGGTVVLGGELPDGPGAFYPPTVLVGVSSRHAIAQEEIVGPVATVIPFDDESDSIRLANDVRYGLTATVWTGDSARGHRVASRIKAGTVSVNLPYTSFPAFPFGGAKQSGFGRELGLEALESYLEPKTVLVGTGAEPVSPPWS